MYVSGAQIHHETLELQQRFTKFYCVLCRLQKGSLQAIFLLKIAHDRKIISAYDTNLARLVAEEDSDDLSFIQVKALPNFYRQICHIWITPSPTPLDLPVTTGPMTAGQQAASFVHFLYGFINDPIYVLS